MPIGADAVVVSEISLSPDTVLCQAAWCLPRARPDEQLAYDVCAGEQHLISSLGRYLYLLCDGLHTVAEITELAGPGSAPLVREQLTELVSRGLVDVLPAAGE